MKKKILAGLVIDLAIFFAATVGTYLAQSLDRPITAVLTFLTGVILIAAHSGLISALIAAIAASFVYNFFLSEPVYQLGLTTADEAVPLLAFNISAIVAGILIGRLKDSASRARQAQAETAFLLTVSDRLQRAIKVEEVESTVRSILPTQGVTSIEIFLARGKAYIRPTTGEVEFEELKPSFDNAVPEAKLQRSVILELQGVRGPLGIARFVLAENEGDRTSLPNLQSVSALLGLAIERCQLLEAVAEAQAAARGEELKDALLSSVSHDLRTPLTVIEAAAGTLISPEVTLRESERRTLLSSIIYQCRRLDRYTSELLDVGRIQAGISPSELEALDLVEIIQLAINRAKSISPSVKVERTLSRKVLFVSANAAMLEQALFNVIDNAQKFGGEGGLVRVSLDTDGDEAVVSVADSGPGISGAEMHRVFGRFFKGSRAKERGGTGLGLFIAKGFIEAFSGTIGIESPCQDGKGTRISIRLPLASTPDVPELLQ